MALPMPAVALSLTGAFLPAFQPMMPTWYPYVVITGGIVASLVIFWICGWRRLVALGRQQNDERSETLIYIACFLATLVPSSVSFYRHKMGYDIVPPPATRGDVQDVVDSVPITREDPRLNVSFRFSELARYGQENLNVKYTFTNDGWGPVAITDILLVAINYSPAIHYLFPGDAAVCGKVDNFTILGLEDLPGKENNIESLGSGVTDTKVWPDTIQKGESEVSFPYSIPPQESHTLGTTYRIGSFARPEYTTLIACPVIVFLDKYQQRWTAVCYGIEEWHQGPVYDMDENSWSSQLLPLPNKKQNCRVQKKNNSIAVS
jgi:hypothetical protein